MADYTEIGKIQRVSFELGGYQDIMIGFGFTLGSDKDSWGVQTFWGDWSVEADERSQWTDEERRSSLGDHVMRMKKLMDDAKVTKLEDLKGAPIEATFGDDRTLKDFRILTEVV